MNTWIKAGLGVLLALSSQLIFAATGGWLENTRGTVQVAVGAAPAAPAAAGAAIQSGATVTTGDNSFAVLKFPDGQVVALQSNTAFRVDNYNYDEKEPAKGNIVLSMLKGGMRALTGLIATRNNAAFKLTAPNATIGIRGTDFMLVQVNPLYASITSGSIGMTTAAGTTVFGAGQFAMVVSAQALPVAVSAAAVPAGTFTQLLAIPVPPATPAPGPGAAGSGAAGTGTGVAGTGLTTGALVGIGAAVAGAVAATSSTSDAVVPAHATTPSH